MLTKKELMNIHEYDPNNPENSELYFKTALELYDRVQELEQEVKAWEYAEEDGRQGG